jgi:hypothetical protein
MVRIAFYCPVVRGTVEARDCAYCRSFKEGDHGYQDVNECRQENLVPGYECSSCKAFTPPGAMLDKRGFLLCAHCVINGQAEEKLEAQG